MGQTKIVTADKIALNSVTTRRKMFSYPLKTLFFLITIFGSTLVEAFTTNNPSSTSFLRQKLVHTANSLPIGYIGSHSSPSALFGKKQARAQGNESKRKKAR